LAESFVKIVHLRENAANCDYYEDVSGWMGKLIVSSESHLERNTKSLDSHNGDGASCRANGEVYERILFAMLGRNVVDHEDRKGSHKNAIYEEAYGPVSVLLHESKKNKFRIPGFSA
jgi:hypothetical protein